MWNRLKHHKLAVVIAVAVLARLAALLLLPDVFAYSEPGGEIHGSVAYDEYARNLLATGVYGRSPGLPDAGLPPLYSLVLAAILWRLRAQLSGGGALAYRLRRAVNRAAGGYLSAADM